MGLHSEANTERGVGASSQTNAEPSNQPNTELIAKQTTKPKFKGNRKDRNREDREGWIAAKKTAWAAASHVKKLLTSPRPRLARIPPVYTKASVLLPKNYAQVKDVHKVHILGADERSRFIAHALSSVYDSVEVLRWSDSKRYTNLQVSGLDRTTKDIETLPPSIVPSHPQDQSPIDHLVVGGSANFAMTELSHIKHRLSEDSTVCLVNDGLGVLEDVRRSVFEAKPNAPKFILGHMNHRLAFNNKYNAVRQLRQGQLWLTDPSFDQNKSKKWAKLEKKEKKGQTRSHLLKSLSLPERLATRTTTWDKWFRYKLPSVLFDSIVDPVCVALAVPYAEVMKNQAARRMVRQLCDEMVTAMTHFEELNNCPSVQEFLQGDKMVNTMFATIYTKRQSPCQLERKLRHGKKTDAEYLNGYFLKKAKALGIDMKLNKMMMDMVLAREAVSGDMIDQLIPFEATTVPPDWTGSTHLSNWSRPSSMRRWVGPTSNVGN